jgi:hypothetical protein
MVPTVLPEGMCGHNFCGLHLPEAIAYKKQMSQPEIASHHGQQTEGGRRPKIFPDAPYFLMRLCVTGASDGAASCRALVVDIVFH